MGEVICTGWLTKSPGGKYASILNGKVKLPVKSKWRKRYFVLSKPAHSLPDDLTLKYYKDKDCRQERGSIDLESCTNISIVLDSAFHSHLFSIEATSKKNDKERVYFLAADSVQEMNLWVDTLQKLCHLQDYLNPVSTLPQPNPPLIDRPKLNKISSKSEEEITPEAAPRLTLQSRQRYPVSINTDSDPEKSQDVYDYPIPARPTRTEPSLQEQDVTLLGRSEKLGNTKTNSECSYESFPEQKDYINVSRTNSIYDVPPSRKLAERPVIDSVTTVSRPEPNVPQKRSSDDVFVDSPCNDIDDDDDIYDMPRSVKLSHTRPPRCSGSSSKIHSYVNAGTREVIDPSSVYGDSCDVAQLSMDIDLNMKVDLPVTNGNNKASSYYTDMNQAPTYVKMASTNESVSGRPDSDLSDSYCSPPPAIKNDAIKLPKRCTKSRSSSSCSSRSSASGDGDQENADDIYDVPKPVPRPRTVIPKKPPKPLFMTAKPRSKDSPNRTIAKNINYNNNHGNRIEYIELDHSGDVRSLRTSRPPTVERRKDQVEYTDLDMYKTQAVQSSHTKGLLN